MPRKDDPTKREMLKVLKAFPYYDECDKFDVEAAIYWFASDYHGGQASNLYSALSTSHYRPGSSMSSVEDEGEMAAMLYEELEAAFIQEDY